MYCASSRLLFAVFAQVDKCCHELGCALPHVWQHVAVGVQRDPDASVAEALLRDLRVDASAQRQCRLGVPEVVHPDPRHRNIGERLRERRLRYVVVDGLALPLHRQTSVLEVDAGPLQAERLTAAEAGECQEVPQRVETVLSRRPEERGELGFRPRVHLRAPDLRLLHAGSRVDAQGTGVRGVVESVLQDAEQVTARGGGEGAPDPRQRMRTACGWAASSHPPLSASLTWDYWSSSAATASVNSAWNARSRTEIRSSTLWMRCMTLSCSSSRWGQNP